jgi:hypothetical protein
LSASPYILEINNCIFTNADIQFSYGYSLDARDCSFTNGSIIATHEQGATGFINLDHCDIYNSEGGYSSGSIIIDDYNSYSITNCKIEHDYLARGISIFNSGNILFNNRRIYNCEIYSLPNRTGTIMEGLCIYNSLINIDKNYIHDNGYGIFILNNSESYDNNITGDGGATEEEDTQRIKNNTYSQIIMSEDCFPAKFEHNCIYNDNDQGNYLKYISECSEEQFDISDNYWGEDEVELNDHLDPFQCFKCTSIWNLQGQLKDLDMAEMLYDSSIVLINDGSLSQAEAVFHAIITTYPSSVFAVSSIKNLYYLKKLSGQGYQNLKYYYDSLYVSTEMHNLVKLSRFFSNQCDVELGNYADAINWNDSVLLNPDTFEDSIFALIDRDYVYLKMQHENGKFDPLGIPSFVPKTYKAYVIKRNQLLDLLKTNDTDSNGEEPPDANGNQDFETVLHQNYPNPFNDQTTFSFSLAEDSDVSLIIYDQLGRKAHSFPIKFYEKGTQTIDFMNDKLAPGVYYYKISINNKPLGARKLMVL